MILASVEAGLAAVAEVVVVSGVSGPKTILRRRPLKMTFLCAHFPILLIKVSLVITSFLWHPMRRKMVSY